MELNNVAPRGLGNWVRRRRLGLRSQVVPASLVLVLIVLQAHLLWRPPRFVYEQTWGTRLIAGLRPGSSVTQEFTPASIDPLTAIGIDVRGDVTLDWRLTGTSPYGDHEWTVVAAGQVDVDRASPGEILLHVGRLPSWNRFFRLELHVVRVGTGSPPGFVVSRLNSYVGNLTIDGRQEFADLALTLVGMSPRDRLAALQERRPPRMVARTWLPACGVGLVAGLFVLMRLLLGRHYVGWGRSDLR
jgi:hypothetical protein